MTATELQESIDWCAKASRRFKTVTGKLAARRDGQRDAFARNPEDYVPAFTSHIRPAPPSDN